jgi:hypothetical protein
MLIIPKYDPNSLVETRTLPKDQTSLKSSILNPSTTTTQVPDGNQTLDLEANLDSLVVESSSNTAIFELVVSYRIATATLPESSFVPTERGQDNPIAICYSTVQLRSRSEFCPTPAAKINDKRRKQLSPMISSS